MKLQGFENNKVSIYRNDCTVRALATVTGIDYFTVFECLRLYGRTPNSGFDIETFLLDHDCQVLRHKFTWSRIKPRGTFLLWNQGHAWAIKDGILFDAKAGRLRHNMCLEVTYIGPDRTEANLLKAERLAKALYSD